MTWERGRRARSIPARALLMATALVLGGFPLGSPPAMGSDEGTVAWPGAAEPAPDPVSVLAAVDASQIPAGGTSELTLTIDMTPGWHINSHKPLEDWLIPTDLSLEAPDTFEVLETTYPPEKLMRFEFSDQDVAVYEGRVTIRTRFRVRPGTPPGDLEIAGALLYQACNDRTCLPPDEKLFAAAITVLPGEGPAATAAGGAEDASVKSRLTSSLSRNFGNPFIAFFLTLLAGLLSAATPCVYPMIPITARILMGRGGESPALGRLHAVMYFLGIILIYMILGTIASVTGGGFNVIMRIPLVLLAFAVLFVLLGLSMLGFFEIQIPTSFASRVDSSTARRSGLWGTVLMGAGAGLVVSPCVGPVVIFILTQIASQMAAVQSTGGALSGTTQVLYGSFLMAGYGAGLGVPFLIVGLFSARLAKPGPWMTAVRIVLGLVILYFAFDYFHKALGTAGVERRFANAILTGAVLIFLAVIWGVFSTRIEKGPHAGWQKVKHASTIILLVTGVFFLWTGLGRSGIVPEPPMTGALLPAGNGSVETVERTGDLVWQRDFATAKEMARTKSLPIFVDFYAHWCANCKKFSHQAAQDGPLQDALRSVILAKVYDTDEVFDIFQQDPRYPELKRGLPFFLLLSSGGEPLWKGVDYRDHDTMIREISQAIERETAG